MDEQQRKHYTNEIARLQTENDRLRRELKHEKPKERDVPPAPNKKGSSK